MITVITGDKYVQVVSSNKQHIYPNGSSSGAVHYNTSTQKFKVNNGVSWIDCESYVHLTLSMDAHRALDWVSQKMRAEEEARTLAQKYVTVQDALDSLATAQERLDLAVALARNEGSNV